MVQVTAPQQLNDSSETTEVIKILFRVSLRICRFIPNVFRKSISVTDTDCWCTQAVSKEAADQFKGFVIDPYVMGFVTNFPLSVSVDSIVVERP